MLFAGFRLLLFFVEKPDIVFYYHGEKLEKVIKKKGDSRIEVQKLS